MTQGRLHAPIRMLVVVNCFAGSAGRHDAGDQVGEQAALIGPEPVAVNV